MSRLHLLSIYATIQRRDFVEPLPSRNLEYLSYTLHREDRVKYMRNKLMMMMMIKFEMKME